MVTVHKQIRRGQGLCWKRRKNHTIARRTGRSMRSPQQASSGGSALLDDSPELLRWRADILLDEMMLGAVDIAAGRPDSVPSDAGSSTASSLSGPESTAAIRADAGAFEGGPRSASSSPIQRESKDSLLSPASQRSFNSGSIDAESQSDPWRIDASSSDWRGSTGSPIPQARRPRIARPAGPQDLSSPEMSPDLPSDSSNNMLRPPSASTALSEARSVTENPSFLTLIPEVAAWSVRQMDADR